jgi:hypothetical protein
MALPLRSTATLLVLVLFTATGQAQKNTQKTEKNPYKDVSHDDRMKAIQRAQVWRPIETATLDIKAGPKGPGAFAPGEAVTCEYFAKDSAGKTPKFWCAITPRDEVKVKYGENNGEVYAEIAASRLLWALGFGSDAIYPVSVFCRGCSTDPHKQHKQKDPTKGQAKFDPAIIERPFPGDAMEVKKDYGWDWGDLAFVDPEAGGAPLAHRDALALIAVFMQHSDTKPEQQRLVCLDRVVGLTPIENGGCAQPFMLMGDVGKTFGKANLFNRDQPGAVNLKAWAESEIWTDDDGCIGNLKKSYTGTLDRPRVSEEGRKFLVERLMQLSDAQIRDLFEVAQVTRRDKTTTVADWVNVFKQKREEIATRSCLAS